MEHKQPSFNRSALQALMYQRGLSTGALAERAGLNRSALHRLIVGDRREPQVLTVAMLAKALGVKPEALMKDAA